MQVETYRRLKQPKMSYVLLSRDCGHPGFAFVHKTAGVHVATETPSFARTLLAFSPAVEAAAQAVPKRSLGPSSHPLLQPWTRSHTSSCVQAVKQFMESEEMLKDSTSWSKAQPRRVSVFTGLLKSVKKMAGAESRIPTPSQVESGDGRSEHDLVRQMAEIYVNRKALHATQDPVLLCAFAGMYSLRATCRSAAPPLCSRLHWPARHVLCAAGCLHF